MRIPTRLSRVPGAALVAFAAGSGLGAPDSSPAQDWTSYPLGTLEPIHAVQNTSFAEKHVVGGGGFVAKSSMGRTVWTVIEVGTTADLHSILEPSNGSVWVGGEAGVVRVKSGASWFVRDVPSSGEDVRLFTREGGAAIAIGSAGGVWKTTNSGADWVAQSSGTTAALNSGAGFVTGPAFVCGDAGTILVTADGGTNWAIVPSGTSANLYAMLEASSTKLACGEMGTMLRSTDTGVSWTSIPTGTTATLRGLSSSGQNSNWVYAVGDDGTVLKSTNNGVTWCTLGSAAPGVTLRGVEAVTNNELIVAGDGGVLLRTTTGGGACVSGTDVAEVGGSGAGSAGAAAAGELRLDGPWPNPVRGVARFAIDAAAGASLAARVVDARGRSVPGARVRTARSGERAILDIDAGAAAAGVYFLHVASGVRAATARYVVVR